MKQLNHKFMSDILRHHLVKIIKTSKRVGRGIGSGRGKTAGKGTKGQKSRGRNKVRLGFEGGQTPINKRLPKFGSVVNPKRKKRNRIINLRNLKQLFDPSPKRKNLPIKLLGGGSLE